MEPKESKFIPNPTTTTTTTTTTTSSNIFTKPSREPGGFSRLFYYKNEYFSYKNFKLTEKLFKTKFEKGQFVPFSLGTVEMNSYVQAKYSEENFNRILIKIVEAEDDLADFLDVPEIKEYVIEKNKMDKENIPKKDFEDFEIAEYKPWKIQQAVNVIVGFDSRFEQIKINKVKLLKKCLNLINDQKIEEMFYLLLKKICDIHDQVIQITNVAIPNDKFTVLNASVQRSESENEMATNPLFFKLFGLFLKTKNFVYTPYLDNFPLLRRTIFRTYLTIFFTFLSSNGLEMNFKLLNGIFEAVPQSETLMTINKEINDVSNLDELKENIKSEEELKKLELEENDYKIEQRRQQLLLIYANEQRQTKFAKQLVLPDNYFILSDDEKKIFLSHSDFFLGNYISFMVKNDNNEYIFNDSLCRLITEKLLGDSYDFEKIIRNNDTYDFHAIAFIKREDSNIDNGRLIKLFLKYIESLKDFKLLNYAKQCYDILEGIRMKQVGGKQVVIGPPIMFNNFLTNFIIPYFRTNNVSFYQYTRFFLEFNFFESKIILTSIFKYIKDENKSDFMLQIPVTGLLESIDKQKRHNSFLTFASIFETIKLYNSKLVPPEFPNFYNKIYDLPLEVEIEERNNGVVDKDKKRNYPNIFRESIRESNVLFDFKFASYRSRDRQRMELSEAYKVVEEAFVKMLVEQLNNIFDYYEMEYNFQENNVFNQFVIDIRSYFQTDITSLFYLYYLPNGSEKISPLKEETLSKLILHNHNILYKNILNYFSVFKNEKLSKEEDELLREILNEILKQFIYKYDTIVLLYALNIKKTSIDYKIIDWIIMSGDVDEEFKELLQGTKGKDHYLDWSINKYINDKETQNNFLKEMLEPRLSLLRKFLVDTSHFDYTYEQYEIYYEIQRKNKEEEEINENDNTKLKKKTKKTKLEMLQQKRNEQQKKEIKNEDIKREKINIAPLEYVLFKKQRMLTFISNGISHQKKEQ